MSSEEARGQQGRRGGGERDGVELKRHCQKKNLR